MDDEIKSLHANQTWTTEPSPKGVKAAKGLMRYVASTREHGIRTDLFETSPNTVVGYCDADTAGDLDSKEIHDWISLHPTRWSYHMAEQATANCGSVHH